MQVFENIFDNALVIFFAIGVVIWFVLQYIQKLGNPEGRKELTDEIKNQKFWDTQTFVILVLILFVYLYWDK